MKRFFSIAFLLTLFSVVAVAQQRPQFTQYMMNSYLYNPAFTGAYDYTDVKVGYRNQWSGFADGPKTFYGSAHGSLGKKNSGELFSLPLRGAADEEIAPADNVNRVQKNAGSKHGLGGYFLSDQTGPTSMVGGYISYAYHLPIGKTKTWNLSLGLTGGLMQHAINTSEIDFFNNAGEVLRDGSQTTLIPDLGAGLTLYSDKYYVGYSAYHLLQNELSYTDNFGSENKLNVHHFVNAGASFMLSENLDLLPSVLLKYVDPVDPSIEGGARLAYRKMFWVGGSYRSSAAASAMAGLNFGILGLAYSYDVVTNDGISEEGPGSHEIMLNIRLSKDGIGKDMPNLLY